MYIYNGGKMEELINGKIIYADMDGIVVSKNGKIYIVYPYCSCNSGFWYLEYVSENEINRANERVKDIYKKVKQ
jgi:hypothetical protein